MNHPDEAPKLSKLPFIAGDLLLIATAVGIGLQTPAPIGPIALLAIGLCVIFGAALLVFPFIVDYARRQDALLTERQNQIAALARTTAESAEQIAIATAGLHSLAESSAQNLKALEKLPLQLQERIDAIAQQLTSAKPVATPVAATTKTNKEELARLEAASEKIARTLAQLEAATQSKTDAAESTSKALADLLTSATSQVEKLALAAAAASTVAAESTAQLVSERAAAAASAATATTALEALAARVETIQLPPAFTNAASASGEPLTPLITTAEPELSGDNADGNDGVFTPPSPPEKPDPLAEESADAESEDGLEDEALTDTEAALDEAPTAEDTDATNGATHDAEPEDSEDAEDSEIEEDETDEDLAEEENALASVEPPTFAKSAGTTAASVTATTERKNQTPPAETNEESDDAESEDAADESETTDRDEEADVEDETDATDAGETDPEDSDKESDEDETADESDEPKDSEEIADSEDDSDQSSDDAIEDDEDTLSPITHAASARSAVTAAPDSFEPSEPHADEVPVDEPVAPKAPRPRKNKPVEDLGFDLGLTPDGQEVAETAVTSDGFTRLVATAYIGIGNKLFIRGQGPGLSWDKGVPLQFVSIGKWRWETPDAVVPVTAKLYKNDQIECTGLGTLTLKPGHQHDVNAGF